jgi:hypothetical protein
MSIQKDEQIRVGEELGESSGEIVRDIVKIPTNGHITFINPKTKMITSEGGPSLPNAIVSIQKDEDIQIGEEIKESSGENVRDVVEIQTNEDVTFLDPKIKMTMGKEAGPSFPHASASIHKNEEIQIGEDLKEGSEKNVFDVVETQTNEDLTFQNPNIKMVMGEEVEPFLPNTSTLIQRNEELQIGEELKEANGENVHDVADTQTNENISFLDLENKLIIDEEVGLAFPIANIMLLDKNTQNVENVHIEAIGRHINAEKDGQINETSSIFKDNMIVVEEVESSILDNTNLVPHVIEEHLLHTQFDNNKEKPSTLNDVDNPLVPTQEIKSSKKIETLPQNSNPIEMDIMQKEELSIPIARSSFLQSNIIPSIFQMPLHVPINNFSSNDVQPMLTQTSDIALIRGEVEISPTNENQSQFLDVPIQDINEKMNLNVGHTMEMTYDGTFPKLPSSDIPSNVSFDTILGETPSQRTWIIPEGVHDPKTTKDTNLEIDSRNWKGLETNGVNDETPNINGKGSSRRTSVMNIQQHLQRASFIDDIENDYGKSTKRTSSFNGVKKKGLLHRASLTALEVIESITRYKILP